MNNTQQEPENLHSFQCPPPGKRGFATCNFWASLPWKDIGKLAIPQILLMLTTLFIGLTDMWVAGRIGPEVQAAIGVITQIQAFMMVLAMALGSGAMAAVAQSFGARRFDRARRYVVLVLLSAFIMASVFSLLGSTLGGFIMNTLGIPLDVQPITFYFWNVILLSLPLNYLYFVSNILFRAAKLVQLPLYIGILCCLINVFGDLAFGLGMFGFPALGVPGIAWSTFAAVATGAVASLILLKHSGLLPKKLKIQWKWTKRAMPYLIKVALPSLLTQALWQSGYLILFGIAASVPQSMHALAGLTAGMRIESILFTPAMAFNATASILVGNALGAGNIAEAKKLGISIVGMGAGIMSVVALCMLPFMDELAGIFSHDIIVIDVIVWYLIFNILSTPFTVGGMILNGIMTGAGATIYALFINTACIWFIRLPLAYGLAHFANMGIKGVFLAMLISMSIQSLAMLVVFYKRPWYKHAMRKIH